MVDKIIPNEGSMIISVSSCRITYHFGTLITSISSWTLYWPPYFLKKNMKEKSNHWRMLSIQYSMVQGKSLKLPLKSMLYILMPEDEIRRTYLYCLWILTEILFIWNNLISRILYTNVNRKSTGTLWCVGDEHVHCKSKQKYVISNRRLFKIANCKSHTGWRVRWRDLGEFEVKSKAKDGWKVSKGEAYKVGLISSLLF